MPENIGATSALGHARDKLADATLDLHQVAIDLHANRGLANPCDPTEEEIVQVLRGNRSSVETLARVARDLTLVEALLDDPAGSGAGAGPG
jgi:hypothetical protein